MVEEHALDLKKMIADKQVGKALHAADDAECEEFRTDIGNAAGLAVALTAQQRAVAQDLGCGVREAKEHRHRDTEKKIGRDVQRGLELIFSLRRGAQGDGDQRSENGSFQKCAVDRAAATDFREYGAPEMC